MLDENEYTNYRISVSEEFESVFSYFYFAENDSNELLSKTFLPTYQTILVFCFGPKATILSKENETIVIETCLVYGPIKQAFNYSLPIGSKILVANFKDDAFFRLFADATLAEDSPINPTHLFLENCFTTLWHELDKMDSSFEQVNYILDFCRPYLKNQSFISKLLALKKEDHLSPIKSIALDIKQSERYIQLHQKRYFGYSVKEIRRHQRFLTAIEMIQQSIENTNKIAWFDIIDQCNYYDQSHLIHDFKHFMKLTPSQFLKLQQEICIPSIK